MDYKEVDDAWVELESLILKDIEANAKTNNKGKLVFYWNDIKDWGIAELELDENGYQTHPINDGYLWLAYDGLDMVHIEHDNIFYCLESDYNEDMGRLTIYWNNQDLES